MQKEDIKIRNQFGAENHFQVPEGYFDNLAASVMQHIPDGQAKIVKMQTPAWRRHIVAISAAAASVAAAVCLVLPLSRIPHIRQAIWLLSMPPCSKTILTSTLW